MLNYEKLLVKNSDIEVIETNRLPHFQSGLYYDGTIFIKEKMSIFNKHETLAEELAHHQLTYGDITDQTDIQNKRYELKARRLANEQIISLSGIIAAFEFGVSNLHEMSQYFEVTEQFVLNTIEHYKRKYGLSTTHNHYLIRFNPLQVYKYIDKTE